MSRFWLSFLVPVFGVFAFAVSSLQAHPGHYHPPEEIDEFADEAFMEGVKHPLTGLDHLLAAVAVGVLAVGMGRQQGAATAGVFFAAMAFGYAAGHAGYALPMLETGLALAVLAVGGLLMWQKQLAVGWKWAALALIGAWNGGAHGLEAANAMYGMGLLTGMVALASLGAGVAFMTERWTPAIPVSKLAGASVAAVGAIMTVSRLGGF